MPEVEPILNELIDSDMLERPKDEYVVDVKIHMLMAKMYPCIPNYHRDFMPRDENGKRIPGKGSGEKMFMWISGAPLTEYIGEGGKTYNKAPQQWHSFTQDDLHRGTLSEEHTWRCFIRVIPKKFIHSTTINEGSKRQHIQVYIPQPDKFTW